LVVLLVFFVFVGVGFGDGGDELVEKTIAAMDALF